MGLSVKELFNLALNLAGSRSDVSSPDEESKEAEICRLWYPRVRASVFRAAYWSCGKRTARLALLKMLDTSVDWTTAEPQPPWTFAYQRPGDLLRPRYLSNYAPFELGRYGDSNALLTDVENAILTYSAEELDLSLWDEGLAESVYYGLAAVVAGPLTGSRRKSEGLIQEANRHILMARETEANQDNFQHEVLPEWLSARGFGLIANPNRYIYPAGSLLVAQSGQ
jgi:hypothetical protein